MYISVSTILFLGIYPKEIDKAHMFIQKLFSAKLFIIISIWK